MKPPVSDVEISIALRRLVVGIFLIGAAGVLGILIAVEADPVDLDVWWNGSVSEWVPGLTHLGFALDFLGGGWFATYVVPIGGALILVAFRRPWAGFYFVAASALSAGLVQVVKSMFGRVRPEEILVISDHGSYPSGHTANAATIAVVAVILLPRIWVAVVGGAWVFVMAFSRTQVHAHWFSDTVGGALFGAGAALAVSAAFAVPLLKEQRR
jgi:undecaprenyl-diphosphatase